MHKYLRCACVIFVGMLASCDSNSVNSIKDFIPGSYVRPFETEFAIGIDSLVLKEETNDHYIILKYSRYSRIMNNAATPIEEHTQRWAGAFDEKDKVIREFQGGKVIHFNVKENTLFLGTVAYKKVH